MSYRPRVARDADAIKCECGGYAERDLVLSDEEKSELMCGSCCVRAFVCNLCKKRTILYAESSEIE